MPKRALVDWDCVESTATQQIISRRELVALGVTDRMIAVRCGFRGPWRRLLPGVVMLRSGTATWHQLVTAALRYAGSSAVVSGLAACRLHGLRRIPEFDSVHLLLPAEEQPSSYGRVIVERTIRLPDPVRRSGFPVAPVERAVLDATRRLSDRDQVRALIAETVQRGYATAAALWAELESGSNRGSALPRAALREAVVGVHSVAEADASRIIAKSRLPKPAWNTPLYTADGRHVATPDAWFDDVGLAWEIDSYEFHLAPADYARTLERHAKLTGCGVVVLHTLPSRLRHDRGAVIKELVDAYRVAAQSPRPRIRPAPSKPKLRGAM